MLRAPSLHDQLSKDKIYCLEKLSVCWAHVMFHFQPVAAVHFMTAILRNQTKIKDSF